MMHAVLVATVSLFAYVAAWWKAVPVIYRHTRLGYHVEIKMSVMSVHADETTTSTDLR